MFLQLFSIIYDILSRKKFLNVVTMRVCGFVLITENKLPYCIIEYIVFSHFRETPSFNMLFLFSGFIKAFYPVCKANY